MATIVQKNRDYVTPATALKMLKMIMRHNLNLAVFNPKTGEWTEHTDHNRYLIPCLWAPPGVGKTAVVHQAANELREEMHLAQYNVLVEKLAIKEPTEVGGYPYPDKETMTFSHIIAKKWRDFSTAPGVAFLDEYAQGNISQQNGGRNITNERKCGDYDLCPGTTIVAASNMMENKAGTSAMPTQAKDVFTHLYIQPEAKEWAAWAMAKGLNPLVPSFIYELGAEYLCPALDTSAGSENAQPSPRSWERVHEILSMPWDLSDRSEYAAQRTLVSGTVGPVAAGQFYTHVELMHKLPDKEDVLAGRKLGKKLDTKNSGIMCLFSMILAANARPDNLTHLVKWCRELEAQEYGSLIMNMVRHIDKKLSSHPAVVEWFVKNESNLMLGGAK